MATISAVSDAVLDVLPPGPGPAGGSGGYPTFDDVPFLNKAILILEGGTENYPIQNKWIRCALTL